MLVYSDLQQSITVEGEGNSLAVNRRVVIETQKVPGFWTGSSRTALKLIDKRLIAVAKA